LYRADQESAKENVYLLSLFLSALNKCLQIHPKQNLYTIIFFRIK
jgi:hypothetical protein